MTSRTELIDKGGLAEECVKSFISDSGTFTVRSLKLIHDGEEVTDVDVWVYGKSNSFSRYKQIIDIKNKKSPAVLERILWTKGLQSILKAESAVVATTNSKASVRSFAEDHNITLIDGVALQTIIKNYENKLDRFPDEYFDELLRSKSPAHNKLGELYISSKTFLLKNLDFDGCNAWLENCRSIMKGSLTSDDLGAYALRVLFLQISYFLIGLDYCLVSKVFDSEEHRKKYLQDGFFFGELGKKGIERIIDNGISIAKLAQPNSSISKSMIREAITHAGTAQNFDLLVEHFSKHEVRKELFSLARDFENLGFQTQLKSPNELSPDQKSLILLLSDVFEVKREAIMGFTPPKATEQLTMKI